MPRSWSPASLWTGRVLSALVVLFLLVDGGIDVFAPEVVGPQMAETGFPAEMACPLGWIVLGCAVIFAVPPTAFIGAILITGFLGGAVATHFRLGEIGSPPQLLSMAVGVATWAGLLLRDDRLRSLVLPSWRADQLAGQFSASAR